MQTGRIDEVLRELCLLPHQCPQLLAVSLPVGDGTARHSTLHGRTGNRHRHLGNETRIDGFRNEIVGTEGEITHIVGAVHNIGNRTPCQVGNGTHGRHLHLFVDGGGSRIKSTSENVGETDDIVDLVGVVGTTRRHDYVGTSLLGSLVGDFGDRICQGKNNGFRSHGAHHFLREDVALGKTDEDIGPLHRLCKGMDIGTGSGKFLFLRRKPRTIHRNDALGIEHHNVFLTGTEGTVKPRTTDGSRTGTVDDNADILNLLACHLNGIDETGARDDGRAVLVVVHDGDVELLLQTTLNFKAFRSLDILKVYATERGGYGLHGSDETLRILLVDLNVKGIHTGINFKKEALSFHYRLSAHGTDVAQSEHGCTVGDDCHQVSLVGIAVGIGGCFLDFQTGFSHTRTVSQRKVGLRTVGLCRHHLDFSRTSLLMIGKGRLFCDFCHKESKR